MGLNWNIFLLRRCIFSKTTCYNVRETCTSLLVFFPGRTIPIENECVPGRAISHFADLNKPPQSLTPMNFLLWLFCSFGFTPTTTLRESQNWALCQQHIAKWINEWIQSCYWKLGQRSTTRALAAIIGYVVPYITHEWPQFN